MTIASTVREVVVRFGDSFNFREAIELPATLQAVPRNRSLVLDFSGVLERPSRAALALLIPALGSVHRKRIQTVGLEHLGLRPVDVGLATA